MKKYQKYVVSMEQTYYLCPMAGKRKPKQDTIVEKYIKKREEVFKREEEKGKASN